MYCSLCFKTRDVELFAVTSSTVSRFWKFFTVGNSFELYAK